MKINNWQFSPWGGVPKTSFLAALVGKRHFDDPRGKTKIAN